MSNPAFESALAGFVNVANAALGSYFERKFPSLERDVIVVGGGRKYVKLIAERGDNGGGRYVYAFVEKETGDIYKPATWKAPAAIPRGNIYSPLGGEEAIAKSGTHIRYL